MYLGPKSQLQHPSFESFCACVLLLLNPLHNNKILGLSYLGDCGVALCEPLILPVLSASISLLGSAWFLVMQISSSNGEVCLLLCDRCLQRQRLCASRRPQVGLKEVQQEKLLMWRLQARRKLPSTAADISQPHQPSLLGTIRWEEPSWLSSREL